MNDLKKHTVRYNVENKSIYFVKREHKEHHGKKST